MIEHPRDMCIRLLKRMHADLAVLAASMRVEHTPNQRRTEPKAVVGMVMTTPTATAAPSNQPSLPVACVPHHHSSSQRPWKQGVFSSVVRATSSREPRRVAGDSQGQRSFIANQWQLFPWCCFIPPPWQGDDLHSARRLQQALVPVAGPGNGGVTASLHADGAECKGCGFLERKRRGRFLGLRHTRKRTRQARESVFRRCDFIVLEMRCFMGALPARQVRGFFF